MKIDYKKVVIIVAWLLVIIFLHKEGLITTNIHTLKRILYRPQGGTALIFLALSIIRVILLIPGMVFMVLGGRIFGPVEGFFLSMAAVIISESMVYFIGKYFIGNKANKYLNEKYGDIMKLTERYGYKFLVAAMLCPIAPLDVICFSASILNFKYNKFLLTLILTHVPFVFLCSFLGRSFESSHYYSVVAIGSLVAIFIYTIRVYNNFKVEMKKPQNFTI